MPRTAHCPARKDGHRVFLLIREGPEWSSVVDVYAQPALAHARAKVLNEGARVSKDTFEYLSSYRVEERKVVP